LTAGTRWGFLIAHHGRRAGAAGPREEAMPHIIVKLWPGKTEEQKTELASSIAAEVSRVLGSKDASVSVAFEEVDSADWMEQVYEPDISGKWETVVKKPGYGPRA
jgi:4-oxalocrotonate tautomerase